jgi:hypothetical protein
MQILHFSEAGIHMNMIEKFCICKETNKDIQLHDTHILQPNKIFEPILQGEGRTM